MAITKPDMTRIWGETAPAGNVIDPNDTTPGKFSAGWQAEVPPFEHFNFIQKLQTEGLAYLNEQGIGEWDTNTVYPVNAIVKGSDGKLYKALSEQSGNDPVSSSGFWLDYEVSNRVIRIGSVAELEGYSAPVGYQFSLVDGIRSRDFEVVSGDFSAELAADINNGLYVGLADDPTATTKVAKVVINDGTVYLSWFSPDTTGATEQEAVIQSAVNLTPDHFTLDYAGLEGTMLVDIPAGQTIPRPRAIYVDHPMVIRGSSGVVTKVKDFSSAWLDYTGVMHVYQAESSDVTIDGVFVDANADNHYETDGSGNKYWETGPEGKRPPNGVAIYCPNGTPNLVNTVIENCDIYRPLGGCGVNGSLESGGPYTLNEPSFLNGTLEENLVVGPIIRNNTTRRARGNDCIFSSGVIDGEIYGNKSYNSMYHQVRFYTSTINCHAWDNHAYVDYDYLATGYNQTDLWYWRTDLATDGEYLIRRSGLRAGSGFTSVIDCSMTDNVLRYQDANPSSSIIDATSNDAASFQTNLAAVKNVQMKNNKSYNSPFGGLFGIALATSDDGAETEGVVFTGNEIYGCFGRQVLFQGNNYTAYDNCFEDCTPLTISGGLVRLKGNKIRYFKNGHKYNKAGGNNSNDIFEIVSLTSAGENEMFVSDNIIDGHTGTYYTQSDAAVLVHGTDVGIKPALENGWVISGGDIVVYINCAGLVSAHGILNGSSSTSDTALSLPSWYGAKENTLAYSVAIQTSDIGDGVSLGETFPIRASSAGSIIIDRKSTNASRAGFMISYQADGRLFA